MSLPKGPRSIGTNPESTDAVFDELAKGPSQSHEGLRRGCTYTKRWVRCCLHMGVSSRLSDSTEKYFESPADQ